VAEHPNVALMRTGYAAFAAGDMDTVGSLFADDIVWHAPGNGPLAGEYRGKEQVFGLFAKLFEMTGGTFRQETHDILANDEHACVLVRTRWEKPKPFEGRAVHVWHIKDGRATEYWLHNEDQAAADAAFTA